MGEGALFAPPWPHCAHCGHAHTRPLTGGSTLWDLRQCEKCKKLTKWRIAPPASASDGGVTVQVELDLNAT